MELPKAILVDSERKLVRKMCAKRRMQCIGSGAFAKVYGRSNCNRVVKVGPTHDSYVKYLKRIGLKNSNPYFPRIHSVRIYWDGYYGFDDKFYVVEMERLLDWRKVPKSTRKRLLMKLGCWSIDEADYPQITKKSTRREKQAIKLLRKLWSGYNTYKDVHEGNIMFRKKGRGYQLVYTDPVA